MDQCEIARCFIIQPFGKKTNEKTGEVTDNNKIYAELRKLNSIRPNMPISVFRADTRKYKDEKLHEHVIQCIKDSHFCIADFSGNNSNVLYETGYAKGIGREVIAICQDRNQIPSDLKELITVNYAFSSLESICDEIDKHLDRVLEAVNSLQMKQQSSVTYFPQRDPFFIKEKICKAKSEVDIIQTNLHVLQGNYLPDLLFALKNSEKLKVRILTLDPQSIFVNFRGEQLGFKENIGLYRSELATNLSAAYFHFKEYRNRFEIRIYDDFPTQICFYIDEEIIAGVVSATGRSRHNCAFLLNRTMEGAEVSFVKHFEYIWDNKSKPYEPT